MFDQSFQQIWLQLYSALLSLCAQPSEGPLILGVFYRVLENPHILRSGDGTVGYVAKAGPLVYPQEQEHTASTIIGGRSIQGTHVVRPALSSKMKSSPHNRKRVERTRDLGYSTSLDSYFPFYIA